MINDASTAFNRFRDYPSLQQGLELGGELLVRASVVAARNGSTVSQDSYDPESEAERGLTQESEIESFSRLNNCWHDDPNAYFRSLGYVFYGYGGEAQVYLEGDSYVHKVCRIMQYDSPQRFFDRICIENAICPEAHLYVEGFGRNAQGDFVVLLRQRFFRQASAMSDEEIELYMSSLGFCRYEDNYNAVKYLSDKVVVEDMHTGNIWKTPEHNIVIIDGFFCLNIPGLGLNGTFSF